MAYLKTDSGDQLTTDSGDFLVTDTGTTATTTTISALPASPQIYGTSITITATVTPSAATGTVNFFDGGSVIGSGILSGGVATYTTSALSVATHSITASYGGDGTYDVSTSSALSYGITAASTSIALSASPSSTAAASTLVTFTATVTPSAAPGTVNFYDGAGLIGSGTLSGGTASFATSSLPAGVHSITATYAGSTNYNTSTSSPLSYTITSGATGTTTTLVAVPSSPADYGTVITLTATVTPSSATGTVNFANFGGAFVGVSLVGGTASYSPPLAVGNYSFTAIYLGDSTYAGSTSAPVSYTVNAVAPPPDVATVQGGSGKAAKSQQRTVGMRPPAVLEYDRPVLTEYAAQLRRMVEAKQLQPAKELAATIAETARAIPQPTVRPQLQAVAEIADRLQRIERLNAQTQRNLARVLEIRAKAVVQAMDDEDAEMLLLN